MHRLNTSFVLGYHGCRQSVATAVLAGGPFRPSENDYDWLGTGVYFWESNPRRAFEWAAFRPDRQVDELDPPAVVGAVIDMGFCLDLMSSNGIDAVKAAYRNLSEVFCASNSPMPKNSGGTDLLMRRLDCAVVNHLNTIQKQAGDAFQTVRGLFQEGEPIYENAGFRTKTHVQICVRDLTQIRAVFRVDPKEWNS